MSGIIDCQEELLANARKKGYLTFDDILDAANTFSLTVSDIDRISNNLQSQGVMLVESEPVQTINEPSELADYSRTNYDEVFSEVLALSESIGPLIDVVKDIPPPQFGEIQLLTEQIHYGNEFARERLILLHLRVVIKIALSTAKQYSYDIEEAISAGIIGIVEAVEHFDPNGFSTFLSYASMWIRQNIHRFCTPVWLEYYCPTHVKEKLFPILQKHNESNSILIHKEEFDLSVSRQISEELGIAHEQVVQLLVFAFNQTTGRIDYDQLQFLDDDDNDDSSRERIKAVSDETDVFEIVASRNLSEIMRTMLNALTPREQEIMRLRFGFDDGAPKTLEELGQYFGITRERVRQIESKSILKLRHPIRARLFEDFYG